MTCNGNRNGMIALCVCALLLIANIFITPTQSTMAAIPVYQDADYQLLQREGAIYSAYFLSEDTLIAVMRDGRVFKCANKGKTKSNIASMNENITYTQNLHDTILIVTFSGRSLVIDKRTMQVKYDQLQGDIKRPLCISGDSTIWALKVKDSIIPMYGYSNGSFIQKTNLVRNDRPRSAFIHKNLLVYDHVNGNRNGISYANYENAEHPSIRILDKEIVRCMAASDNMRSPNVVCGTETGDIIILDMTFKVIDRISTAHKQLEYVVSSAKHVVAISDGGVLCVYDISKKTLVTNRILHDISPGGISLAPSGNYIVVWTVDGDWEDRRNKGYAVVHRIAR